MHEPIGLSARDLPLVRAGGAPLFTQIASALERRIRAGEIGRGVRLSAVRVLADELGVNRATIQRAYRELESLGLVESRVGSGTQVIAGGPVEEEIPADTPATGGGPRSPGLSRGILELARAVSPAAAARDPNAIDFAMLLPDVALFPRALLAQAVDRALARGDEILQYGSPAGLTPLRRGVAERLRRQGIETSEDEIIIVNGIQQALDLIAKALIDAGDTVVVESPTYANVLPLLKLYGGQTVSVPLDDDGIIVDRLEKVLQDHHPKLLYTMPSFQNPTGVTMSLERRRALLKLCGRAGTLVVEDGCEQEIHFADAPLPPLAALDTGCGVAHLGTVSKDLFPGLRLGYIHVRGELRRMLELAKRYSDYHSDLLSQAVLAELLANGEYDRHLERLRTTYRARMQRTLKSIRTHLPPEVRFREPQGGYKVWLELPDGVRADQIVEAAGQRGVQLLAGTPFFDGTGDGDHTLRISITRTDPKRIDEGMKTLGAVLRQAIADGRKHERRTHEHETPPLI